MMVAGPRNHRYLQREGLGSGALLFCTVAPSIAAKIPFSSIFERPLLGVMTRASGSYRGPAYWSSALCGGTPNDGEGKGPGVK